MPSLWEVFCVLLEFLPQVFLLYIILSLIEKSGLMSWVARCLHLPVGNLMAISLGFGCTTLAICAARDLPARRRLVYLVSFIPCTAQLPLITFLFLSLLHWPFWSVIVLYLASLLVGLIVMLFVPKNSNPVIIEPVRLHWPNLWACLLDTLKQTVLFAKKIFIAFAVSAFVIVILARFTFHCQFTTDPQNSILFSICGVLSPLFRPLGLDNPAIICALLFGIIAKESAVSVLLFFPGIINALSIPAVLALVVFYTLYPKCIAAQTAMCSTCNRRTSLTLFITNLLVAYGLAFVVYTICGNFI